jgi:hypothetical protein
MAQLAAGRGGEVSSATERQLAAALARVSELEAEVRSLREAVVAAQRAGMTRSQPPPCASPGLDGLASPRRPAALGAVACTRITAAAARRAAERAALGPEACAVLDAALVALVCGDGSAAVERSGGSASGGGGGAFALVGDCVIDGTELCRLLLRGADPNTRIAAIRSAGHDHENSGRGGKLIQMTMSGTPLHCASGDGNLAAVRMLLAAGAVVNAKDGAPAAETGEGEGKQHQQQHQHQQQQRTPLEYATDEQVARALMDHGGVEAAQLDE